MIIRTLSCLLAAAFLCSCANTQVSKTGTLEDRVRQQAVASNTVQPPPPAEGPEDLPPNAPMDVQRNPGLVPSPLLRASAASDTP
jgi:hypothetical protein